MEDELQQAEVQMRQMVKVTTQRVPRLSTATAHGASTNTSGSACEQWRSRLAHICGFALFGCGAADKVRKCEVALVQQTIICLLSDDTKGMVMALPRYALNHNVSFRAADGLDPWGLAVRIDKMPAKKSRIINTPSSAAAEDSPSTRCHACRRTECTSTSIMSIARLPLLRSRASR